MWAMVLLVAARFASRCFVLELRGSPLLKYRIHVGSKKKGEGNHCLIGQTLLGKVIIYTTGVAAKNVFGPEEPEFETVPYLEEAKPTSIIQNTSVGCSDGHVRCLQRCSRYSGASRTAAMPMMERLSWSVTGRII